MNKYRFFCEDENCNIYHNSDTEPTVCPNDATHIIRVESITSMGKVIPDVTPRQMRQALILQGISIQQIEDALATLPSPQKELAQTEWEYSISFNRDRYLVSSIGQLLGWNSQQLDDLWLYAATL